MAQVDLALKIPPPRQPLLPGPESRTFWGLRTRRFLSMTRVAMASMRMRLASITLASLVLWIGLFWLFFQGFHFIYTGLHHVGMRTQFVHAIFNVFFLALTAMLLFSSGIILYGNLFKTEEVRFLLTTPASPERIVLHKFHEAVFFSCWGFVLLGSPMLIAYGVMADSPWYYYALLAPFMVAFVLIPAGLGAIACLAIVRLLPTARVHALLTLGAIAIGVGLFFGWHVLAYQNRDLMTPTWFQDVLSRLEFSEQRMLPSWWLSTGLLEAAHPTSVAGERPAWRESLYFLAVLSSNALLLQVILAGIAKRAFRISFSELQGLTRSKRQSHVSWMDRVVMRICRPFPASLRIFIIKDLRLFRRDPVQWSQFLIFFSLLMFYFFNVRRFDYGDTLEQWVTVISFLNVAVVGLILSTFTTRFIFPMISLEGRRFWILGTAPIRREMVLWGKFWFACAGAIIPCSLLVLASDVSLNIVTRLPLVAVIHQLTCWVLCVGLSAMAVGLGARLPNLREPSPSKIAAGFGGTLNLILSALYIIAVVSLSAVPAFFWAETSWLADGSFTNHPLFGGRIGIGSPGSVVLGVVLMLALGGIATYVPLRIGKRAFDELEF
jgi:ABC-2 type transport system permease protein